MAAHNVCDPEWQRRDSEWGSYIRYLRNWTAENYGSENYGTSPMSWSAYADKCGFGYVELEEEQDE